MVFGHVRGSDIYQIIRLVDFTLTTDLASGRSSWYQILDSEGLAIPRIHVHTELHRMWSQTHYA